MITTLDDLDRICDRLVSVGVRPDEVILRVSLEAWAQTMVDRGFPRLWAEAGSYGWYKEFPVVIESVARTVQ